MSLIRGVYMKPSCHCYFKNVKLHFCMHMSEWYSHSYMPNMYCGSLKITLQNYSTSKHLASWNYMKPYNSMHVENSWFINYELLCVDVSRLRCTVDSLENRKYEFQPITIVCLHLCFCDIKSCVAWPRKSDIHYYVLIAYTRNTL